MSGRLVYVMGPSGVGKDSLLGFARARAGARVLFAHRYITRPRDAGEDHVPLTPGEFAARKTLGLFALDWQSHGFCYGIGIELDAWLACGVTVVVNGSREHVEKALARHPNMTVVDVTATPEVLAARLAGRGRESTDQIERRLARQISWTPPPGARVIRIDNSGLLTVAGEAFVRVLERG